MKQTLRPYQAQVVDDVRDAFRRHRRVVAQLPTGAGKTTIAAAITERVLEKGGTAWFVAHRRELVNQAAERMRGQGLEVGIVMAGHEPVHEHQVQVISIDTYNARRRNDDPLPPHPRLLVVDEAHHAPSPKWDVLWEVDAFTVGLSATPYRADGTGLGERFGGLVVGPKPGDLEALGHLVGAEVYCGPVPNLGGVKTRAGDWQRNELADAVDGLVADVARTYKRLAPGKRAICFAVNRAHSEHLVTRFEAEGFRAAHLDFTTKEKDRKDILDGFRDGRVQILCNVEIVTEGFDVPDCEVVILARPTKSEGLYVQMVGRGLRPSPGKTRALVLDHGYNVLRHGDPLEHRPASMEGRQIQQRTAAEEEREAKVRLCETCLFLNPAGATECRCGASLAPPPPEVNEEVELRKLELKRLKDDERRKRLKATRVDARRSEFKQLTEFAKRTGKNAWWPSYVYMDKYGKMPHEDTILTRQELGAYWKARKQ